MATSAQTKGKQRVPRNVRFFTKAQLVEAVQRGPEWDYNRQLAPSLIGILGDNKYPVTLQTYHEHRHGVRCETHMRCVVYVPEVRSGKIMKRHHVVVDVPMEFYDMLGVASVDLRR